MSKSDSLFAAYITSGNPAQEKVAREYQEYVNTHKLGKFKEKIHSYSDRDEEALIRVAMKSDDPVEREAAMAYQNQKNQDKGLSDWGNRYPHRVAKSVAKGIASLGDLATLPYTIPRAIHNRDASGLFNWSEGVGDKYDELTNNATLPVSNKERVVDAVVEGVSGIPSSKILGMGVKGAAKGIGFFSKKAPKLTKATHSLREMGKFNPQNIAATAGGEAAAQAVRDQTDNGYLSFGAGLLGGGAGSLGAHGASRGVAKNMKNRVNEDAVHSFREAGIPYGLADVSTDADIHMLKDSLPRKRGAKTIMNNFRKAQIEAVDEGLGHVGTVAPGVGKRESLGIQGMAKYKNDKDAHWKKRYDKRNADIETFHDQSVPLTNTGEWLETGMHRDVRKRFMDSKQTSAKELKTLFDVEDANGFVSIPFVEDSLSEMGGHIKTNNITGNKTEGRLKKVYAKVLQDLEDALEPRFKELGQDSYDNYQSLRKDYRLDKKHNEPHVESYLKNAVKDEHGSFSSIGREHELWQAMENDLKTGGRGLIRATQGLTKEEGKQLAQAFLKNLGTRSHGEKMIPAVLETEFNKLHPYSKTILLNLLGKEERKKFEATLKSIGHSKIVQSQANHSHSGHHLGAAADMADYTQAAMETVDNLGRGKGIPRIAFKVLGGIGLNNLGAKAITRQSVPDWIIRGGNPNSLGTNLMRGAFLGTKASHPVQTGFDDQDAPIRRRKAMMDKKRLKIHMHPDAARAELIDHHAEGGTIEARRMMRNKALEDLAKKGQRGYGKEKRAHFAKGGLCGNHQEINDDRMKAGCPHCEKINAEQDQALREEQERDYQDDIENQRKILNNQQQQQKNPRQRLQESRDSSSGISSGNEDEYPTHIASSRVQAQQSAQYLEEQKQKEHEGGDSAQVRFVPPTSSANQRMMQSSITEDSQSKQKPKKYRIESYEDFLNRTENKNANYQDLTKKYGNHLITQHYHAMDPEDPDNSTGLDRGNSLACGLATVANILKHRIDPRAQEIGSPMLKETTHRAQQRELLSWPRSETGFINHPLDNLRDRARADLSLKRKVISETKDPHYYGVNNPDDLTGFSSLARTEILDKKTTPQDNPSVGALFYTKEGGPQHYNAILNPQKRSFTKGQQYVDPQHYPSPSQLNPHPMAGRFRGQAPKIQKRPPPAHLFYNVDNTVKERDRLLQHPQVLQHYGHLSEDQKNKSQFLRYYGKDMAEKFKQAWEEPPALKKK